jgi:2-methylcitrate dehydratase
LVEYVQGASFEKLSVDAVRRAVQLFFDGVGCAIGAMNTTAVRAARQAVTETVVQSGGCTVIGSSIKVPAEQAAFANASAFRHLDYNDSYPGLGHPSDMMPALLAAVELVDGSGRDFVLAANIAYDVFGAIAETHPMRGEGFDQGFFVALGVAAGCSKIFKLSADQTRQALSFAASEGLSLRNSRCGELSMWKGSATAHGAMNGLFAARIARAGMTAPEKPFEGVDGVHRQVAPTSPIAPGVPRFDLPTIQRVNVKFFPVENQGQAPLIAVQKMRSEVALEDIESVRMDTYYLTWHEIGGGQGDAHEKWNPKTRESADHSMPYLFAAMLLDGKVDRNSFTPERISDPAIKPVMDLLTIREDPEYTKVFPGTPKSRFTVKLRDGSEKVYETDYPPGHWKRPMTEEQLDIKFDSLTVGAVPEPLRQELKETLRTFDTLQDVRILTERLAALGAQ